MATMKVTAFEVKRCGYYRRGNPIPEFGNLADILADIQKWVAPKSMAETQTFTPDGEDVLPTYCFDIRKAQGNNGFLLTTWNEVPMTEGGVPVASGKAKVGQVSVELAEVADGDIPGFPTYFYFVPEHNVVFAIRPEHQRHTGHQGLLRFMRGYIEKASSYVVLNPDAEDVDNPIAGYRNGNVGEPQHLFASYSSALRRLPGQVKFLRDHCDSIRKLVRFDTLQLVEKKDRNLFGRLLENAGLLDRDVIQQSMSFRYELEFKPTLEDLDAIIDADEPMPNRTANIGFVMKGSPEVHWIDHAFAKDDIDIKVVPSENGVLPAADLLTELVKQRARLLGIAEVGGAQPLNDIPEPPQLAGKEKVEA